MTSVAPDLKTKANPQQLEDEVRPVVVPVSEQHRPDPSDVGAVPFPVLLANRLVVGRHRISLLWADVP